MHGKLTAVLVCVCLCACVVQRMLSYDPAARVSAKMALRQNFFSDVVICRPPYLSQWETQWHTDLVTHWPCDPVLTSSSFCCLLCLFRHFIADNVCCV